MIRPRLAAVTLASVLTTPAGAWAQSTAGQVTAPQVLTLDGAIQYAVDHYPTVRAALEQVNASAAGVTVAKAAYLPRLDSLWQSNRGTANNIFGQVFPQSIIPAMSGPVLPSASGQSVWGSATGALFSWEPFDFGLRDATVVGAEAAVTRARAGEALTRLDVQSAVGAAFLGALSAQRAVIATQADFDRRDVLARTAHTLVDNQLRPGAEASRADAERAAAQTRLIQAQAAVTLAQTTMTRVLGITAGAITIDGANLLNELPATDVNAAEMSMHPLAQVHQAAVDATRAQEEVLARTDRPRLFVQSSVFARGSGANPDGQLDGGFRRSRVSNARIGRRACKSSFRTSSTSPVCAPAKLPRRRRNGRRPRCTTRRGSRLPASSRRRRPWCRRRGRSRRTRPCNSRPRSRANPRRARAIEAGLASILEVADAQSLLAQAEFQDQLARVDVWRALLAEAVAQGTLASFLTLIHPSSGAR